MKAKLIKKDGHYFLEVEPNTWTPPNRFHSIIANTLDKKEGDVLQLSLKNCQAIELGYDLDELAILKYPIENMGNMYMPNRHEVNNVFRQQGFKAGFQIALELMGDKKYTNLDLIEAIAETWNKKKTTIEIIESLQQTEWDVEIEIDEEKDFIFDPAMGISQGFYLEKPKLDADDCIILKLVKS